MASLDIARVPDLLASMRHKMKRILQDARQAQAPLDSFAAEAVESGLYDASLLILETIAQHNERIQAFTTDLDDMRRSIEQALSDDPSILRILSSEKLGQCSTPEHCAAPRQVRPSEVGATRIKRMSHSRSRPASIHTDMMSFFVSTETHQSEGSSDCSISQAQWPESDEVSAVPHSIAVASLLIAETSRHAAFAKYLLNAHLETVRFEQTLHKWQDALRTTHGGVCCEFLASADEALGKQLKILSERVWPSLRFVAAKSCSVDTENPWSEAMTALVSTMSHFATLAHISSETDFVVLLSQRVRLINTDVKMIQLQTRCDLCRSANGAFKMRCCQTYICPACMHEIIRSESSSETKVARICKVCGSVTTGGRHSIMAANLLARLADCILQHAKILKGPLSEREKENSDGDRGRSMSTRAGTSTEDVVASVLNDALSGAHD